MQVIGLALLALLTGVLVAAALDRARPLPVVDAAPLPGPAVTITPAADPVESPSPTPASPAETPSPTPTPEPSPEVEPLPSGLAGLRTLIERDAAGSVLVFGDGSGDERDEWVYRWTMQHLAAERPVSYRSWDRDGEEWRPADPDQGEGALTVWNASRRAPDLAEEPARVAKASRSADVVLLSYGHRKTADQIAEALPAIHAAVLAQNPTATVIVLLQNPDPVETQYQQRATVEEVERWATAAGLDTVNIYDAFLADPTPRAQLVEADGSPTPTGSVLWARQLHSTILADEG